MGGLEFKSQQKPFFKCLDLPFLLASQPLFDYKLVGVLFRNWWTSACTRYVTQWTVHQPSTWVISISILYQSITYNSKTFGICSKASQSRSSWSIGTSHNKVLNHKLVTSHQKSNISYGTNALLMAKWHGKECSSHFKSVYSWDRRYLENSIMCGVQEGFYVIERKLWSYESINSCIIRLVRLTM